MASTSMLLQRSRPSPKFRSLCPPQHRRCSAASFKGYSALVDQALMLLVFQQDLGVRLQQALNHERYEMAQAVREQQEKLATAFAKHRDMVGAEGGMSTGLTSEGSDALSTGIRLQAQLQEAVEKEDYTLAAEIRDKLQRLQEVMSASEKTAATAIGHPPALRLGQRVMPKGTEMHGAVVGWDHVCCESASWQKENNVDHLPRGAGQPFYHLLVDARHWPQRGVPVAYIAEEALWWPGQEGSTWLQAQEETPRSDFQNPFSYLLFLGPDAKGDLVPSTELRAAYHEARQDVYPPGHGEQGSSGGDGNDGRGSGGGGHTNNSSNKSNGKGPADL